MDEDACLENNFEAELQRTGGAKRKHARTKPDQVRTVAPRRAVQGSRRSIQDAAKRLAWRVEVLPVEKIVDANLRLDRQALPRMEWLDLPSELQVKGEHVAEALLTRWRSRNRWSDCAERDQLRSSEEPRVHQRLPSGSQLTGAARIPLVDQIRQPTDADIRAEGADSCSRKQVAGLPAGVAGQGPIAVQVGSKDCSLHPVGWRRQEQARRQRAVPVRDEAHRRAE